MTSFRPKDPPKHTLLHTGTLGVGAPPVRLGHRLRITTVCLSGHLSCSHPSPTPVTLAIESDLVGHPGPSHWELLGNLLPYAGVICGGQGVFSQQDDSCGGHWPSQHVLPFKYLYLPQQVLEKKWEYGNPHALLVGLCSNAACFGDSVAALEMQNPGSRWTQQLQPPAQTQTCEHRPDYARSSTLAGAETWRPLLHPSLMAGVVGWSGSERCSAEETES